MANLRSNQASEALVQYESGQDFVEMQQMDQTDQKTFTVSDTPWSDAPGKEPVIRPDGMLTGGAITPTATTDDSVEVAAGTCWQGGVLVNIPAATGTDELDFIRAGVSPAFSMTTTNDHCIVSVIVNATGEYELLPGTAAAAFDTGRGDAGGPPEIPQGQIEVGQIRLTSQAAGQVTADEIFQVEGTHKEMALTPVWSEDYATGTVTFISNLPSIHAADGDGNQTKRVFAEVYTPQFADLEPASDFVPIETTHSVTSTEVYGGAIGASSSSLGQAAFTVYLRDGITDPIISLKNTRMWVKFFPHRLRAPYSLTLGTLGISRTYPAGDNIQAACTLTGNSPTVEMAA